MPSPKLFRFSFVSTFAIEAMEREEFKIFQTIADEEDQGALNRVLSKRPAMLARMYPLVAPWREQFIQYRTSPEIDEFYELFGLLWTRRHYESGHDAFAADAVFGGLTFTLYKAVVVELVGWALKHVDFCQALLVKHPELQLRNILTIFQEETVLSESLSAALDISESEATQALATLKLNLGNKALHTSVNAGCAAPLLTIGQGLVIRSIAGSLISPFDFMLAELRRRYPADWDRAVDERERRFRQELYAVFPGERFARSDSSVKLRVGDSTATDVDAVVFDKSTNTLGLFQLKWQDPFGASLRKRETKKMNFMQEGNRWVSVVSSWMRGQSPGTVAQRLGLGGIATPPFSKVRLFILGRHFAHFSGDAVADPRAAWGMWPQVIRLVGESYDYSDPIDWLYASLNGNSPLLMHPPALDGYAMKIGEHEVIIEPIGDARG